MPDVPRRQYIAIMGSGLIVTARAWAIGEAESEGFAVLHAIAVADGSPVVSLYEVQPLNAECIQLRRCSPNRATSFQQV